jgi:hypothetical protein
VRRTRHRRRERVRKHGTLRFMMLIGVILLTTVAVTVAMFQALALLVG